MKACKIIYITITIFVIFSLQIGIQIINNKRADSIRIDLLAIPSPDYTVVEDSLSVAGKQFGNGNGMQYTGIVLVQSLKNKEYLEDYYNDYYSECEVKLLELSEYKNVFEHISNSKTESFFVIIVTHDIESGTIPNTLFNRIISDCDLRGH